MKDNNIISDVIDFIIDLITDLLGWRFVVSIMIGAVCIYGLFMAAPFNTISVTLAVVIGIASIIVGLIWNNTDRSIRKERRRQN